VVWVNTTNNTALVVNLELSGTTVSVGVDIPRHHTATREVRRWPVFCVYLSALGTLPVQIRASWEKKRQPDVVVIQ